MKAEASDAVTQSPSANEAAVQARIMEAVLAERERCARVLEIKTDALLLRAGEMSSDELLTVKAVLADRARVIRNPERE